MRVTEQIEPCIASPCFVKGTFACSPFAPLSEGEGLSDWGREYRCGLLFAHENDLYRAITAFKRALFLLESASESRRAEINYMMLLAYYLGERFEEVDLMIKEGALGVVDNHFAPYKDLLLVLYDSYRRLGRLDDAHYFLSKLDEIDSCLGEKFERLEALQCGDLSTHLELEIVYRSEKKSVRTASMLNALVPGAGYYYVGQKQTALTAFLVNGLFIAGAVEAFIHRNIPLGIILTSLESGWYFGGIYGGGLAAKAYNENLFNCYAGRIASKERLFPILHLNFSF